MALHVCSVRVGPELILGEALEAADFAAIAHFWDIACHDTRNGDLFYYFSFFLSFVWFGKF